MTGYPKNEPNALPNFNGTVSVSFDGESVVCGYRVSHFLAVYGVFCVSLSCQGKGGGKVLARILPII